LHIIIYVCTRGYFFLSTVNLFYFTFVFNNNSHGLPTRSYWNKFSIYFFLSPTKWYCISTIFFTWLPLFICDDDLL